MGPRRSLRRRWLWWAKPLPPWAVVVILVLIPLRLAPVWLDGVRHPHAGYWRVPAPIDLHRVTGTLDAPLLQGSAPHVPGLFWGKMTLTDGTLFWFTCKPGDDSPMCAYSVPANRDPNLGKRFAADYFDVASHRGANHVLVALREIECTSCAALMTYADRRPTLRRLYWLQFSPTIGEWLLLILAAGLGPGLAFRLATGRGERPSP